MINIMFGTETAQHDTSNSINILDMWRGPIVPQISDTVHLKGRYYRVVRVCWLSATGVYLQVENLVSMNKKDKAKQINASTNDLFDEMVEKEKNKIDEIKKEKLGQHKYTGLEDEADTNQKMVYIWWYAANGWELGWFDGRTWVHIARNDDPQVLRNLCEERGWIIVEDKSFTPGTTIV